MSVELATDRRIAVVVYEDADRDLARAYRGLLTATEFLDAGEDVTVVYDGSGVDTLAAASVAGHALNPLVEKLRSRTRGACGFCARAHGVEAEITAAGWSLLAEYKGHASIRDLMVEGYQLLSF